MSNHPSVSISSGNSKLGAIPNFSLVPVRDCVNCDACKKKCYALKAWRMYPSVKTAWSRNSKAVRRGTQWKHDITAYLAENKPPHFRIHVAGDFYSTEYFLHWIDIVRQFPETRFLAFTKSFAEVQAANVPIPENLSIVFSAFPGLRVPDGFPVAWAGEAADYPEHTDRVKKAIVCPGKCETCHLCWHLGQTRRDIRFHMH